MERTKVMKDIYDGKGLTLKQAGELLPGARGAKYVSPSTIHRWIITGAKTSTGVVKLEAAKIGMSWFTSKDAVDRFMAAITAVYTAPA